MKDAKILWNNIHFLGLFLVVFAMSSICTMFSTWFWITDENMANVGLKNSPTSLFIFAQ